MITTSIKRLLSMSAGILIFSGLVSAPATSQIIPGYVYVSDYSRSTLERYTFSYNQISGALTTGFTPYGAGGSTTNAVLIASGVQEGLQGTANDLIVVANGGAAIARYNLDGTKIGNIPISGFTNGKTQLQGVGNVALTADGKYMYAPDEAAGYLYKINLMTGVVENFASFTGVHDVKVGSDGVVYAEGYTSGAGIMTFTSNLTSIKTLVTGASISRPTGISLTQDVNGNTNGAYVMSQPAANGGTNGPDSVYHYSFTGSGASETASVVSNPSSSNLRFSFGDAIGPDGNVYSAELGAVFGSNAGYTGGIYKYDTTTQVTSLVIAGSTYGTPNTYGLGGLGAPKYLEFNTNFLKVPDAGVPEPGNAAMFMGAGVGAFGLILRRRVRK